jgi:lipopolysaccharide/colanic/teichoic acid biosynthesis glycosyltransferase
VKRGVDVAHAAGAVAPVGGEMKMDMQYIDNWSLALDWQIMLRTIPRFLTGRGAY